MILVGMNAKVTCAEIHALPYNHVIASECSPIYDVNLV